MSVEENVDHPLRGETLEVIIKEYSQLLAQALSNTSMAETRIIYVNELAPLHKLIMVKAESDKVRDKFETLNDELYLRFCIREDERIYVDKEIV